MLAWQQQLKVHGIRTAILSNMGDTVLANIEREFDWLPRFDTADLEFSAQDGKARSGDIPAHARSPRDRAPTKRSSSTTSN